MFFWSLVWRRRVCEAMILRSVLVLLSFFTFSIAQAQVSLSQYGEGDPSQAKLAKARLEESPFATLDVAREVVNMDALPDGSHWFVVDRFGVIKTLVYDGMRSERAFNEIPNQTAQLSPKGDYMIWLGLDRHYTETGFDSTIVYIYRDQALVASFLADYPALEFSRTGKSWGVLLPYANVLQQGDRDFVVINGSVVGKNLGKPRDLSFDHNELHWMYRATEKHQEFLISREEILPYTGNLRAVDREKKQDSAVYRLTPDMSFHGLLLEGRDYDNGFVHVASLHHTSFRSEAQDTAHAYVRFRNKTEPMFRWVQNVLIDTAGKHITYFACDPAQEKANGDQRRAVVVHDGAIIGGPFDAAGRIFLSPSGEHVFFSTGVDKGNVYLDKKLLDEITQAQSATWSRDEKHVAYSATGSHGKVFVVLGGKRSRDYERIGKIGWLTNGKGVEYIALVNGKLFHVKQYL
jgi:hypothetical protein